MEPQTLQNAEQFVPIDRDLAHHRKPAIGTTWQPGCLELR
jgi:hypothetical protein